MRKATMAAHEPLTHFRQVKESSNRSFGLLFAGVFGLVGFFPLVRQQPLRMWALPIAALFLTLAFMAPQILEPAKRLWLKLGLVLQKVVTPVIIGLMFFVVVTPMGLLMRLFGKDLLRMKWDRSTPTYWLTREADKSWSRDMRNQF